MAKTRITNFYNHIAKTVGWSESFYLSNPAIGPQNATGLALSWTSARNQLLGAGVAHVGQRIQDITLRGSGQPGLAQQPNRAVGTLLPYYNPDFKDQLVDQPNISALVRFDDTTGVKHSIHPLRGLPDSVITGDTTIINNNGTPLAGNWQQAFKAWSAIACNGSYAWNSQDNNPLTNPPIKIQAIAGNVPTIFTSAAPHGLVVGDQILVSKCQMSPGSVAPSGVLHVLTTPSNVTFTTEYALGAGDYLGSGIAVKKSTGLAIINFATQYKIGSHRTGRPFSGQPSARRRKKKS